MVVQHNLTAMNHARQYDIVTSKRKKSTERLSSGYRLNRAADDAANLTISEKMRAQIRGLNQASDNAKDGISLLQIADGALDESQQMIHRIKELAVKAANGTNTDADRQAMQDEIDQLVSEIDRIADASEFNTLKMLDGSYAGTGAAFNRSAAGRSAVENTGSKNIQAGGDIIMNPVVVGGGISAAQAGALNGVLENSIVPQAVNSILNTFQVFDNAQKAGQLSNEIGLTLYKDSSSILAYVAIQYKYNSNNMIVDNSIKLNLSVNVGTLKFDSKNDLTADSCTALETTIVHEMMHAFMDDLLTDGMVGANNGKLDKTNKFPSWFSEGMAQSAAGGCANTNDWVNSSMKLNAGSSLDTISSTVKSAAHKLSSRSTSSQYGTGYLASMYLGYLAAGSPSTLTSANLAGGLNTVMTKLAGGDSLSDVIKQVSGGKYTSLSDFERKFGDDESSRFIQELLKAVGNAGNGGVVKNLTDSDLLSDSNDSSPAYQVDTTRSFVPSSVGGGRNWGSGGSGGGSFFGAPSASLGPLVLQIGTAAGHSMSINLEDAHAVTLGLDYVTVLQQEDAKDALSLCDDALALVSANRSQIGAYTNRLEHAVKNLDNSSENTQAAESKIRDTDMAAEMVEYTKGNILAQVGEAMLTHANQNQQQILQLLQ